MTLEIILFISIAAFITSIISLWGAGHIIQSYKHRILEMHDRLNYLEAAMSYHDLLPMPWEMKEFEDEGECSFSMMCELGEDDEDKIKIYKQEGNVVYLQKDEHE